MFCISGFSSTNNSLFYWRYLIKNYAEEKQDFWTILGHKGKEEIRLRQHRAWTKYCVWTIQLFYFKDIFFEDIIQYLTEKELFCLDLLFVDRGNIFSNRAIEMRAQNVYRRDIWIWLVFGNCSDYAMNYVQGEMNVDYLVDNHHWNLGSTSDKIENLICDSFNPFTSRLLFPAISVSIFWFF